MGIGFFKSVVDTNVKQSPETTALIIASDINIFAIYNNSILNNVKV